MHCESAPQNNQLPSPLIPVSQINLPQQHLHHQQQQQQQQSPPLPPQKVPSIDLKRSQSSQSQISHHQQLLQQQQQQPLIYSHNHSTPNNINHLEQNDESKDLTKGAANVARRGPWAPDEDNRLLDLILLFGASNWVRISQVLSTRTPKQCRERYHQNLKPSLNRTPITQEEGELIEQLVATCGKKWAEIARHLNGRSDNAVKNWWNGGANRRRRASAQLESDKTFQTPIAKPITGSTVDKDNNDVLFNTGIFTQDDHLQQQQQQQLQLQQQQQRQYQQIHPSVARPLPLQRSISFDFKYPQQLQQQQQQQLQLQLSLLPTQQQQQLQLQLQNQLQDHYHLSNIPRKQRKLIDEPGPRRHSAVYLGTSSPLSHPPSISSRNSSLSHDYTGVPSYNSSDSESISRRSSAFGNTSDFYQHRKNNLSQHSNIHLSPSFQPQQSSRLSISSQLSTGINLPPLSPTTFSSSRQNSIHAERLPPLSLLFNSNIVIPSANVPTNTNINTISNTNSYTANNSTTSIPSMSNNVFKREFSFSKLDNSNLESPNPSPSLQQTLHHQQQHQHPLHQQHSGTPVDIEGNNDNDKNKNNNNNNSNEKKESTTNTTNITTVTKEDDDKRRMSIANLLG